MVGLLLYPWSCFGANDVRFFDILFAGILAAAGAGTFVEPQISIWVDALIVPWRVCFILLVRLSNFGRGL
jgi:hypothetical protein